ncbi:hypothetical protein [uncultured Bradyrhizobium sp.]|jgi:hypothetical protein|uniref:hypothetical protein n=1 Tax=uncultured Bradyrhizobium sp. TaxID=199684 RepID=UPI0026392C5D|nr:hypothetical protein [uncultured Bradyrhizobium sp.]
MAMIIIFSALGGAVLGTRFKVFILFPVSLLALVAVTSGLMLGGSSLSRSLTVAIASIVALQLGYLGGVATRFVMVAARLRSLRKQPAALPR